MRAEVKDTLSTPFHVQNKATMFLCITSPLGTKTLLDNVTAIVLLLYAVVGVRRMCHISRKHFKHCRLTVTRTIYKNKNKFTGSDRLYQNGVSYFHSF